MYKNVLFALAFFVAQSAFAAGNCQLKDLTDTAVDGPLCLFYMGTAAYRDKNFEQAAHHWKALIALKSVPAELTSIKLRVYNNLGFLYYTGKGVKINKIAAVDYWKYAFKSGHDEAAYHLCHTYADPKQATYRPRVGREYCEEALRRYGAHAESARADSADIVGQVKEFLHALPR